MDVWSDESLRQQLVYIAVLSDDKKMKSAELAVQDKALAFLKDVVKLDLAKCNVTLSSSSANYPPHWGGLAEEDIIYNLDADGSKLCVTFTFREKMLCSFGIEALQGSPIYAESQPADVLGVTKTFLERYQTFSGVLYIQEMRNMLGDVDATNSMKTTMGNIKLTIANQEVQNDP